VGEFDQEKVVEGHLVSVATEHEHETEFVYISRVSIAGIGLSSSLESGNLGAIVSGAWGH